MIQLAWRFLLHQKNSALTKWFRYALWPVDYNWLMVYGGIFPTFPDAEHGKNLAEAVDFQVGKGDCRRSNGVDVADRQFCLLSGTGKVPAWLY
jgi:hypothetical protein